MGGEGKRQLRVLVAALATLRLLSAQAQEEPPPLTSARAGEDYLTFGDEWRLRYERYDNNAWGGARKPDEHYWRLRLLPYADLHLGPRFRLLGQLQGAWSTRDSELKNPLTDETGLDLVQGFGDWVVELGEEGRLTLRAGRQVMEYGSQRIISSGPNIRFSFDGGLIRWERGGWTVDAFAVRPVLTRLKSFNDTSDESRALWAVYATRAPFDFYYMGYENDQAVFNQGTGPERRHTLGVRYFGSRGPWAWDVEANLQTGDFAGADIRAGSLDTAVRYSFGSARHQPFVGVRLNFISGDKDRGDRRLGSFNPMFPTGQYFGDVGQLGPINIVNLRPNFGLQLAPQWQLTGALTFFWRHRLEDGIYGPGLDLVRPDGGSRARYIGTQAEAALDWQVGRNLSFRFVYGLFEAGRFIEETGPARTVHFVQANAVFKY